MTGAGITLYMLYTGSYALAAITVGVFAPLIIIFHFAMGKMPKSNAEWWQRHTRKIKLRV